LGDILIFYVLDSDDFATGMNGDEDLGEDITMKGDKFHFVQPIGATGRGNSPAGESYQSSYQQK
jgi:hypothetical protein